MSSPSPNLLDQAQYSHTSPCSSALSTASSSSSNLSTYTTTSSTMPNNMVCDKPYIAEPSDPLPIQPSNANNTFSYRPESSTPASSPGRDRDTPHVFLDQAHLSPAFIPGHLLSTTNSPTSTKLHPHNPLALKLKIPTSPLYQPGTSSNGPSSPSSVSSTTSKMDSSPPRSSSYTEVTPLPSPLIPNDSTAAIFKAFNGQSPPSTAISRASSVRNSGLRFSLRQSTKHGATAPVSIATAVPNRNPTTYSPILTGMKLDDDGMMTGLTLLDNNGKAKNVILKRTYSPEEPTSAAAQLFPQQPSHGLLRSHMDIDSNSDDNNGGDSRPSSLDSDDMMFVPQTSDKPIRFKPPSRGQPSSNRSVSEYVPQPIVPISFVSYRRPSTITEDTQDQNDTLKDRTNRERDDLKAVPVPSDTIQVEKRPLSSTKLSDLLKRNVTDKSTDLSASSLLNTQPSETNKNHESSGATTSIIANSPTPLHNVQFRSASSGTPGHASTTIQRERPVVSSTRQVNAGSISSSLKAHLLPNFQHPSSNTQNRTELANKLSSNFQTNQDFNTLTQNSLNEILTDKIKIPATSTFISSTPSSTAQTAIQPTHASRPNSQDSQNQTSIPPSESASDTTACVSSPNATPAVDIVSSPIPAHTEKITAPGSDTAVTSTSSGSISSSASIATTSSIATSTASQESAEPQASNPREEGFPERVFEAYDTNMKKSTWNEINLLGRGAFSRVILACPADRYLKPAFQGRSLEFKVAIKVVDIQIEGNHLHSRERMESGLKREIEVLKSMKHPSLIRMYAFNIDQHSAMMVLPLCQGGDLFDLIINHRKDMKCGLVRRIFGEICRAVAYLHSNYIVHRDIKLENVLLNLPIEQLLKLDDDYQRYPKAIATITDMGLSRKIDPEDPNLTTRCGSVDYVPPELLMGQPYDGRQTDSWALGVLLYAMMEGRLPFDPPVQSSGRQVRGKVAHRIARVEWSWVYFKDHHDEEGASGDTSKGDKWEGGMELVEGALQKRDKRLLATDMVNHPWVKGSAPEILESSWINDISHIFK